MGFPGGSAGKQNACNVRDLGLAPGLGRSPGAGKGYPLQYSGLGNTGHVPWTEEPGSLQPVGLQRIRHYKNDRNDSTVHGVAKSWTKLSCIHFHFFTFSKFY